jgi:hypothetical protein
MYGQCGHRFSRLLFAGDDNNYFPYKDVAQSAHAVGVYSAARVLEAAVNLTEKKIKAKSFVLPLLLLGVAGHGVVTAQSAGTFTATGNMTTGRIGHTATLLLDGKVLIAGGRGTDGSTDSIAASAEIYDPATGTFAPAGDLTRARVGHSATLLPDGRVLIAGGFGPLGSTKSGGCPLPSSCGQLTSAEIYDPSSGTFTVTGDMIAPGDAAVLLLNGKVFISAGYSYPYFTVAVAQAQLYDPSRGTFSASSAKTPWRYLATLLANGQALLTGDSYPEFPFSNGDVYDPATDTVSPIASPMRTLYGTATLLMNGKVLFTGDADDYDFFYKTTQLYDPSTGTFTVAGSMTINRGGNTTTLLPDGTVLIAGTQLLSGVASASAEIYDPVLGTFEPTGSMIRARFGHKATLLNNGQVLMTGGYDRSFYPVPVTSSAELYTPRVLMPAPVLLSLSGDGRGQGAIWHATTGQVASAANPAVAGEVLSMYTTSLADGGVIPPQVAIGGRLAEVQYFGGSGYPGYSQVNFRVPDGVPPGAAVSVRLTYMGRSSNAVSIGVQ